MRVLLEESNVMRIEARFNEQATANKAFLRAFYKR